MLSIHSIETFGTQEGPGLRFVIFVQGCNFHCLYCHNPDTQEVESGKSPHFALGAKGGKKVESDDKIIANLIESIEHERPYFGDNGGVTVSGGEPLLQAKELTALFKKLKPHPFDFAQGKTLTSPSKGEGHTPSPLEGEGWDEVPTEKGGIHTALDTNGSILNDDVKELLEYTNLVLLDIKHINPEWHEKITGFSPCHFDPTQSLEKSLTADTLKDLSTEPALSLPNGLHFTRDDNNKNKIIPSLTFLDYLKEINKPVWIRYVLVPGYTDQEEYLKEMATYLKDFDNIERIEILPYHTLGMEKYEKLGWKYVLEGVEPPTTENIEKAKNIFELSDKKVAIRR